MIFLWITITTIFLLIFSFYIFILNFEKKIKKLEYKIKLHFLERSWLIPSIFEVSKDFITKHDEVFKEILKLRKIEFSEEINEVEFFRLLETKKQIHHELNFIFKICNKHPKLIKEGKFIYLRELIINKSSEIWNSLDSYKLELKKFNKFIDMKNMTIIWFLLPIEKRVLI